VAQLTLTFDRAEAQRRKEQGMARSASAHAEELAMAREIAVSLAERYGTVTADDVRAEYCSTGRPWIGNAAGSLFRGKQWQMVDWHTSIVPEGHGNLIRKWRLLTESGE
jgi:hypothetical protein